MSLKLYESWQVTHAMIVAGIFLSMSLVSHARDDNSAATVLLKFKGSVSDPSETLSSWSTSDGTFCQWNGVACNTKGTVSRLTLRNLALSGSLLVSTVTALPLLLELSVSGCNFTDAISMNYSYPCSLEVITFTGNRNMTIGSSMFGCKSMKVLNVSNNESPGGMVLSSVLPLQTGNFLEVMDLSFNLLTGDLPALPFSSCRRLRYLDISHNNFTGFLSESLLQNCTLLLQISLAYNNFQGTFPSIHSLPFLEFLDASFNNFTGAVPLPHGNLKHLNLSSNRFDTVKGICSKRNDASKLESLILVNNKLTGAVLDSITGCSRLKMLDLSFNSLTGEIPSTICDQLPKLEHFLAWVNNLHGPIPSNLISCTNLTTIILSFNNLSGSVPFKLISDMPKLEWLTLSNNNLSGDLPSGSLNQGEKLSVLQLSNNSLRGEVPGNVTMQTIDLRGNNLSGSIPASFNGFTGSRPAIGESNVIGTSLRIVSGITKCGCIDNIFMLQGIALEAMWNLISDKTGGCRCHIGFLPASCYNFTTSSPVFVDVSYNRLVGSIPGELGNMTDALYLSVAHNFLSGTIPVELGELRNVKGMDLSFNALQGSIPSSFTLLYSLVVLDVSHNNLSGKIPESAQLGTLEASSYEGNAGLCGFPLAHCKESTPKTTSSTGGHNGDDSEGVLPLGFGFTVLAFTVSCICTVVIDTKYGLIGRLWYLGSQTKKIISN